MAILSGHHVLALFKATQRWQGADPKASRRFGHSRHKHGDCVQVFIALIVTPEGFPLACEVLAGNTTDKSTLKDFLARIETQHGRAQRTWVMDRGIPTEETLELMRKSDPPVNYLVGTPKGRLGSLESALAKREWQQARPSVRVKLLAQEGPKEWRRTLMGELRT